LSLSHFFTHIKTKNNDGKTVFCGTTGQKQIVIWCKTPAQGFTEKTNKKYKNQLGVVFTGFLCYYITKNDM
jgi:hypothetical protein